MTSRSLRNAVIALSVLASAGALSTIARSGTSSSPIGRADKKSPPAAAGAAQPLGLRVARNGRWIAYSTAPASEASGGSREEFSLPTRYGSDVFVTRVGGRPQLVAGRSGGRIWNLCPAFSPNGRMLAFARVTARQSWKTGALRSAIVVVRVGPRGPTGASRLVLKLPGGQTRCPRWSADSSRVAYLDRRRTRVVVRDLHSSRRHRKAGDPTIRDFDRSRTSLLSPTGQLIASMSSSGIVVSRPDGSNRRVIPDDPPSYAIAGWSPDGHSLLLMRDVCGCGFVMSAVSVDAPYVSTGVAFARVNNARSWPGYGDVSWQPNPSGG
jgi:WD40 repeat protein